MSWLLVLIFCIGFAQDELSENRKRAKNLYNEGEIHFDKGQYTQALFYFKQAYELLGHYKFPRIVMCPRTMSQGVATIKLHT